MDFEGLVDLGLLKSQNLKVFDDLPHDRVNFQDLELSVNQLLEKSYKTFIDSDIDEIPLYGSFSAFRNDNAFWLDDYCLYRALKTRFEQKPWNELPADFRDIEKALEQKLTLSNHHYVQFHAFQQYLFEFKLSHHTHYIFDSRQPLCSYSVLRVVLTPQISNLIQTPIFRSGWVVGITPYAQFCPIPAPHIYIFSHK